MDTSRFHLWAHSASTFALIYWHEDYFCKQKYVKNVGRIIHFLASLSAQVKTSNSHFKRNSLKSAILICGSTLCKGACFRASEKETWCWRNKQKWDISMTIAISWVKLLEVMSTGIGDKKVTRDLRWLYNHCPEFKKDHTPDFLADHAYCTDAFQ